MGQKRNLSCGLFPWEACGSVQHGAGAEAPSDPLPFALQRAAAV